MAIKMRMPVRVTGVTLDKSSINLTTAGDTEQLTATISPANAEDTAVSWSSSDTTVATVSTTGLVTCVTPGNATITVTTHDGGYTATCGVTTGGLPSTYQEVEWIGTTGTQFLDTGIFAYNSYQVETKIEVNGTSQEYPVFACFASGSQNVSINRYYAMTCYQSRWYCGINGSEVSGGSYNATIGTQYEIVFNNASEKILSNNALVGSSTGCVGYPGSTIALARRGDTSSWIYIGCYKYFYFNIYDKTNSEYVMKLVPCYRKSDSVIGMYDLVSNTFFTNTGTGTFTKGSDV